MRSPRATATRAATSSSRRRRGVMALSPVRAAPAATALPATRGVCARVVPPDVMRPPVAPHPQRAERGGGPFPTLPVVINSLVASYTTRRSRLWSNCSQLLCASNNRWSQAAQNRLLWTAPV